MTAEHTYSIASGDRILYSGDFMECMKNIKHMSGPLRVIRDDGVVLAQKTAESGGLYWKYMKEKRESSADTPRRRGRPKQVKNK